MRVPVMAVDPSLRATGVALGHWDGRGIEVERVHLVETAKTTAKQVRKNSDDLRCARFILGELLRLRREHGAVVTIVEVPAGTQSARASWALGVMVGVVAALPLPVVELSPVEVKKGWAGSKAASKDAMVGLAVERYPGLGWLRHRGALTAKNEHLADAVAVMHVGAFTEHFQELVRMLEVAA